MANYPIHPGQTHAEPCYCTIPLEEYEKIDELKESIDELQKATDSAWSKVNGMYDELRYQKFKRCLAMAKWCRMHDEFTQLESERLGLQQRTLFFEYRKKAMWWNKWHKLWLGIAEKFKENVWHTQILHKK